eukprot:6191856-Pleurochrysis_carterae.AAC.1
MVGCQCVSAIQVRNHRVGCVGGTVLVNWPRPCACPSENMLLNWRWGLQSRLVTAMLCLGRSPCLTTPTRCQVRRVIRSCHVSLYAMSVYAAPYSLQSAHVLQRIQVASHLAAEVTSVRGRGHSASKAFPSSTDSLDLTLSNGVAITSGNSEFHAPPATCARPVNLVLYPRVPEGT